MDHHALVSELHRRADLHEQSQSRGNVQVVAGAVLGDGLTVDQLHDDIGNTLFRRAAIEQARDVRVLQTREDLPLGAQTAADER